LQEPPRQVTTPAAGGWASITAGFLHTCAIRTSGTLWCWGDNENGQLGIGNHTEPDQPRQVTGCAQQGAQLSARPSRSITAGRPGRTRPGTAQAHDRPPVQVIVADMASEFLRRSRS